MAYDFKPEDKEIKEFGERIPYGVTKVQFVGCSADVTAKGQDIIDVTVVDANGSEDNVRLFFTGGAGKISFGILGSIAVHQGKDEEEKQAIRDKLDSVNNNEELADLMNEICGNGGELWFTKYIDTTRTYEANDGTRRPSVDRSIMSYEPKLKQNLMPKEQGTGQVSTPFGEATETEATPDASSTVPGGKAWEK